VLGPRLSAGSQVQVNAYGAVGLFERFMYDDKLICSTKPISPDEQRNVLLFLRFYAWCKGLLNIMRGHAGPSYCDGWGDASAAIARAMPVKRSCIGNPSNTPPDSRQCLSTQFPIVGRSII
jgi:inorganic pyrophosphatase